MSSTSSIRRDTSILPTKCHDHWLPAKARFWSWMRRREFRPRHCPIYCWRWTPAWKSYPSSTRSICRAPSRTSAPTRSTTSSARSPRRSSASRRKRVAACRSCWRPWSRGNHEAPFRALIFDSYYDRYRGAIPSIRVVDGVVHPGMKIAFGAHRDDLYEVDEVGYLQLGHKPAEQLEAGEVGYVVANVRGVRETRPGDTILDAEHRDVELLPGYRDIQSMVFAGLYPTEPNQFEELRDALAKLQLNDASLHYEPESSVALGFGFRCGF